MPSADAAAAAGALVRRRLADRLDLQLLDLVAVAVALDARHAGVDHVADARHRQRGLGDVGRQHDAARAVRLEDASCSCWLTGARTAAGSRRPADGACAGARRRRGSRARPAGTPARRPSPAASRRRSPRVHSSSTRLADRVVQVVLAALARTAASASRPGYSRPDTSITGAGPVGRREVAREALGVDRRRGDDRPSGRAGAAGSAAGSRAGSRC